MMGFLKKIKNSFTYRYEHYLKAYFSKKKFLRQHKKCALHKTLELRNPDCIELEGYAVLGENTKLLCTKQYDSGLYPQKLSPKLFIGNNFHATRNFVVQCAGEVRIGKDVLVASDVFIIDFNHGMNAETVNYLNNPLEVDEVEIGDGVWIGNNVTILPGVHIGHKSIIGAGGVVSKDIPPYSLAVGNPARVVKRWNPKSRCWERI